jgi:hypothetical protein
LNCVVCIRSVLVYFFVSSLVVLFSSECSKKEIIIFQSKGAVSGFIQKSKRGMKVHSESSSAKTQNLYQAHIQLKPVTSPNDAISEKKDSDFGKKKLCYYI